MQTLFPFVLHESLFAYEFAYSKGYQKILVGKSQPKEVKHSNNHRMNDIRHTISTICNIDWPIYFYRFPAQRERFASPLQDPVIIQVSNHVLNQISSRVYAIYLKEHLGYNDIVLEEIEFQADMLEEEKLYQTFEQLWR